jgi:hypothetical protein
MAGITINTNVAVPQQGFQVETPSERLAKQVPQPTQQPVVPEISAAEQEYFGGAAAQAVPEVAPAPAPQQFQFTSENIEDPTLVNIPQVELTPELQGQELIKQQQRANYGNVDFDSREELRGIFGDAIKTPEEGAIWHARDDLVTSATKQDIGYEVSEGKQLPLGTTGLNYIQNSLGLSDKVQASNVLTTGILSAMQVFPATRAGGPMLTSESDADALLGLGDQSSTPETIRETNNVITPEQGAQLIGKAMFERAKAAKAASGLEVTEQEAGLYSAEGTGRVGLNSAIDAGIFQVVTNDQGTQELRLTPNGTELSWYSRGLTAKLAEGSGGRAQIFPVTDTGEYSGVFAKIRKPDRNKPTIAEDKYVTPKEIVEAKRIAGSVGLQIPTAKLTIVGLLGKLALKELETGVAQNEEVAKKSGAARLFNLDGKKLGDRETTIAVADLQRDFKYLADNFLQGNPLFPQHFEDNSTHRLYNDSTDANMQRSKVQRAVYVGMSTPIQVKQETFRGITLQQAKAFWEATGKNVDKKPVGLAAEYAFLFGLGHAMSADTDDKTPMAIMLSVTPEKLEQWADTGRKLIAATRLISDNGKQAVSDFVSNTNVTDFDPAQLPPEIQTVFSNLINDPTFDRETFGYKIQGYIDSYNYLQAKANAGVFTPFVTTAIDKNSAGRAMLAMDIGNLDVLERVGLIWNYVDNELNSTQPFGNPRSFFTDACADTAVKIVFNSSDLGKQKQISDLFKKYSSDKDFTKSFSKSVLLTTDYGKAIQYHIDDARKFLFKNPEFKKEFMAINNYNEVEAIDKINELYGATLRSITDTFQYSLPKDMVRTLQMLGTMFSFKGMMNETVPLGGSMFIPTGDSVWITDTQGNKQKIEMTKAKFDQLARGESKRISDIHGNEINYTPDLGSAAANQIGPLFGQYRESMVLMKTMLAVNGGKKATDMAFMQPVFDNFILDSQSLARVMYYANNVAVPEVLDWDIQEPIYQDFVSKVKEGLSDVSKIGTIFVNRNSKYYGVYSTIDREYKFIEEKLNSADPKERVITPRQKQFKSELEKYGYSFEANRDDNDQFNEQTTGANIAGLVKSYMAYKDIAGKKQKWIDLGLKEKKKALERIKRIANEGMIAFMN